MQQSNVIFAVIFFAFLIFVTIKGELPAYLAIFFGSGGAGVPSKDAAPKTGSGQANAYLPTKVTPQNSPNPQSPSGLPTFQ